MVMFKNNLLKWKLKIKQLKIDEEKRNKWNEIKKIEILCNNLKVNFDFFNILSYQSILKFFSFFKLL